MAHIRVLPENVTAWVLACAAHPDRCRPLASAAPRTGRMLEAFYVGQISTDEILFKHLEQIVAKIGVENRAAAAIQVVNLLQGGFCLQAG